MTFGPRNDKNWKKDIPKKMKKKALLMVLSEKAKHNHVVVLDALSAEKPKTKTMAEMMKKLPVQKSSRLVLYAGKNNAVYLSARNIKNTGVLEARNVSLLDLLNYKYVVLSKDAIKEVEKTFLK